ncbi:MAG TPA: NADAR family protein [Candidatus Paceibacterota bacterium]
MWDPLLETSGKVIGFYEREFYCFSNFSSFAVEWKGRLWQTSEHAYQAAHFMETNPEIVEEIYNAKSAHDSKQIAKRNKDKFPIDWDSRKVSIMEDICFNKLQQHPFIQKKLLETEAMEIVEDSPKDSFWGWGPERDGRNELGKVWMKLRDKLQNPT